MKKGTAVIDNIKKGFNSISLVLNDGKAKILARPLILAVIVCGGLYYSNGILKEKISSVQRELQTERSKKEKIARYDTVKKEVREMEAMLPDISQKDDWLYGQAIETLKVYGGTADFDGMPSETQEGDFLHSSLKVKAKISFEVLGKLLADFENKAKVVKVSEVSVLKDEKELGENNVNMTINTVFLRGNPTK